MWEFLKNLNDSENFEKPEWIGEDISFDKRYDNTLLSKIDNSSLFIYLNS